MGAGSGRRIAPRGEGGSGSRSRSRARRRRCRSKMSDRPVERGGIRPHPAPAPALVVLVIEDEAPIGRFLRASLDTQGYRLIEAATGEDGLREAGTRQPDVVLLDLGLPDLDGLEVIRRLREWTAVPIIVLSARGRERDKVAALDAG